MNRKKRITANLPEDLLKAAMKATKKGTTDTLIIGLQMIQRTRAGEKAKALKGKLHLNIDLDMSRERHTG